VGEVPFPIVIVVVDSSAFHVFSTTITIATTIEMTESSEPTGMIFIR
jgi:hypothetical protein